MLRSPWRERVRKLNSSPEYRLFEVGPSGTLVGGDLALCKGPDDMYPVSISGLRPGIWHIALTNPNNDHHGTVAVRWVSPGSLNFDNLPTNLPNVALTPLTPLQRVGDYIVDGGIHGLFDRDSLSHLIRIERNNREYVLEAISDYWLWGKNLAVQVGFVVGGADGPYRIMARRHNNAIVEMFIIPSYDNA